MEMQGNDCVKCNSKAFVFCGHEDKYTVDCEGFPCHSTEFCYDEWEDAITEWNKNNPINVVTEQLGV